MGVPGLSDEDQVGEGAADIDADATPSISGHCLLTQVADPPPTSRL
jgi:hypothetical protein